MKKYLYSYSTETELNLEKLGVFCESAGHVESQGQSNKICDYCGKEFSINDEKIQTANSFKPVLLCRSCYNDAGNSVR